MDELISSGGKVDNKTLFELYEKRGVDDGPIKVHFKLQRDLQKRLDKYLVDRIPFLSRTALQHLIEEKMILVNGRNPKSSTKLRLGDTIEASLPPPPSPDLPEEEIPLNIIFEDDHLAVINKNNDIIVHPARGNQSGTMINGLAWHFRNNSTGKLSDTGKKHARPGVVHRLDRHTTGVIIFAKNETAHWKLADQFRKRTADKRYIALVHGIIKKDAEVIDLPIGRDPIKDKRYSVRYGDLGKQSITICRVIHRFKHFTLVELELKTGRTHQIRVHLSHMGHPIAGDDWYGGYHLKWKDLEVPNRFNNEDFALSRQALHSATLIIKHPIEGISNTFKAMFPKDMNQLLHTLFKNETIEPKISGITVNVKELMT